MLGSWPSWLRVAVPALVLVLVCWLLIWLFSAFLMVIVKGVVGLLVVVGMVALARVALVGREPGDRIR